MSDTVGYKGKLEIVEAWISHESLEERCERILFDAGKSKGYCDTFVEALMDDDDFVIVDEVVYKFIEKEKFDYENVAQVIENDDGTIDFLCVYYNGGTSLEEVIEDAISDL